MDQSKCTGRSIQLTLFFFMKSHPLDQEFLSFKNPKLASYSGEKDTEVAISFGYLLLSYFGVFSCHEIQLSYYFRDHFQKIFLKKWWVDSSFIHLSISSLFGFGSKPNFFLDSKKSWDRVWCGLQKKKVGSWKWKVLVKWSKNDW